MEYFLNQLINGLCQGSIYALMAIGYSVIVGVVGMVTFTYGEIMMIVFCLLHFSIGWKQPAAGNYGGLCRILCDWHCGLQTLL